ncbi:MAG: TIM barrel protein [Verrucomicrobiales bacterium]|nr:sugar phosphate isomerase/epimerase [Verrucomicrobiales bacterium]
MKRRHFLQQSALLTASVAPLTRVLQAAGTEDFRFRYLVGSSMYGELPLRDILPDVSKTGAKAIDVWPRKHGNQREQIEEMGHEAFAALLTQHGVTLGCSTRYDLGPFKLQDEMRFVAKLGGDTIVTGGDGPKEAKGAELKEAVRSFCEKLKPHLAVAEETGINLAIENHGNNLIDSADSLRWLAELSPSPRLGIALAPYHLENLGLDAPQLAALIRELGPKMQVFYAWQYGMGCMKPMPKSEELMQMPGRGELDFSLLVKALRETRYAGYTEIFMHPTPRGVPILETAGQVTAEINRSRAHLESLLAS